MQVDTLPVTGSRATQFFVAIAIVMVVCMAIGFGPSLYLRRSSAPSIASDHTCPFT
jgi:hypothetical protein